MHDRIKLLVMLGPALGVIGALFFGGLALVVARSLGLYGLGADGFSLAAYRAVFAHPAFGPALGLSLYIALASTLISAVLALGAALLLRRAFAGRRAAMFVFQMNLSVPHLVGAIGIFYLISQSGSFARLAYAMGAITAPAQFPALVYDPYAIGIIVQYVWKEVPFIGLITLAALQSIGQDYEAAARSHGAGPLRAFGLVTLPQIAPSVIASLIIVFTYAFGAYEVPLLLGQSHPPALPVLAWRAYTDVDLAARPQAAAMAVVIAAISGLLVAAYLAALRWAGRR